MKGIGFVYAAAAAIGNSCIDGSRKLASQRFTTTELIGLVGLLDAVFLALAVFGSGKYGSLNLMFKGMDLYFLQIVIVSAGIKVIAGFLYQRALQLSPLSVTVPYLAFTPVLLVFTSFALMHEMPSLQGLVGVIVVTVGGYLLAVEQPCETEIKREKPKSRYSLPAGLLTKWLNSILPGKGRSAYAVHQADCEEKVEGESLQVVSEVADRESSSVSSDVVTREFRRPSLAWIFVGNIFEPLLAVRREQGSLLMLGVAGLLSISHSLDKMGSHLAPSPFVFAAVQKVIMAIPVVIFLAISSPSSFRHLFGQFPALFGISLVEIVAFICYLKSLESLLVAYSIAAKRSNVLISVIVGKLVFKEKILRRLPFILLMVGGMTLIVFA